jgi:hypothetical protein
MSQCDRAGLHPLPLRPELRGLAEAEPRAGGTRAGQGRGDSDGYFLDNKRVFKII